MDAYQTWMAHQLRHAFPFLSKWFTGRTRYAHTHAYMIQKLMKVNDVRKHAHVMYLPTGNTSWLCDDKILCILYASIHLAQVKC